MKPHKQLVLDANILLRAVHGYRVRAILQSHADSVSFLSPHECFEDTRKYIPTIARSRNLNPAVGFEVLGQVEDFVEAVEPDVYSGFKEPALARIAVRDPDDWPVVATALLLNAPIWTEDHDFFGCGIATWTSDRVEIYLRNR